MTPSAVRMVLVEGENADGPTLDHDAFDIPVAGASATSGAPQQVVDAILGTRESALAGAHRLTSIGVAWTDHAAAGRLRGLLRSHRLDDVVLVSELHAASALAQAIGQTVGYERTALLFVERDTATLAVVRSADGAVVRVTSRRLQALDIAAELQGMVSGLDTGAEPAQAIYLVGSGVDAAALEAEIASATSLPVHAPQDGDLALARGAALASATTPRYEASTVGLASTEDTAAGVTQMAGAGYMAPLGYSAVSDDDDEDLAAYDDDTYDAEPQPQDQPAERDRASFVLVGSALSSLFVVGVAALAVTLAVVIRPTADQRPTPAGSPVVSSAPAAVPARANDAANEAAPPPAPETIQAPIPVVQEAPRTVVVAPQAPAQAPAAAPEAAPAPVAPPPAPEPAPAPPPAPEPPPAPAPSPAAPPPAPAPSPAAAPPPAPIVVPVPIFIPPIFQAPARPTPVPRTPVPRTPSSPSSPSPSSPSYPTYTPPPPARTPYPTSTPPVTTYPTYPTTTVTPSAGSGSSGSSGSGGSESGDGAGSSTRSQNPLWPLWPFGG